ncbi:barstar family protein [Paenarthrobacter ureafaciens]|uniref:barstar family protein n=1 Tax=Paenarthrobacter ureafaciens TaxID=37931 RepID=UPI003CE832D5
MKIEEISKQFAVHLGVESYLLDQLVIDARRHGMMVFELDLSALSNVAELCQYLETEFKYPYRTAGLDAAIDLISDLEWFGNTRGYLIVVRGASDSSNVSGVFASLLPPILDVWRKQGIPFVVALEEKGLIAFEGVTGVGASVAG